MNEYRISSKTGFLIENPSTSLPKDLEAWNGIVDRLCELTETRQLRQAVHKYLQPLNTNFRESCKSYEQKRLGHLILSVLSSAYIWQDGEKLTPKILPKCLARNWYEIASDVGLPPMICHADLVLANCIFANEKKSKISNHASFNNLTTIVQLPGGPSADWFFLVTAQIELDAVPGINAIFSATLKFTDNLSISNDNYMWLNSVLQTISLSIRAMTDTLSNMYDRLSPDTFYRKIRPFLNGFGGANSSIPEGIIYEGVSEEPFIFTGGSAAQSTPIQLFDEFLGIKHDDEFLMEQREFMPKPHKDFLNMVSSNTKFPEVLDEVADNHLLKQCYLECVDALVKFRNDHIQLVARYIIIPSRKTTSFSKESEMKEHGYPGDNDNFQSLEKQGTGGQPLIKFLKKIRESTLNAKTYLVIKSD